MHLRLHFGAITSGTHFRLSPCFSLKITGDFVNSADPATISVSQQNKKGGAPNGAPPFVTKSL